MNKTVIIGILVKDRIKEANRTQKILTNYADVICNRLGFHEVNDSVCSRLGFILLHIKGQAEKRNHLLKELATIGGIEVKTMEFV